MPLVDLHTHICLSKAENMLGWCKQQGLHTLGISEHVYQLEEIRSIFPEFFLEGTVYSINEYLAVFEKYKQSSLELLMGLELDILPGKTAAMWERLKQLPWDYVIGSVHELDRWDIHWEHRFNQWQCHEKWRQYMHQQMEWLKQRQGNILGHPVRMAVSVTEFPSDLEELIAELAQCARQNGIAIELNARDYRIAPELVDCLVRQCAKQQCMVSVGSDAHQPEDICREFVSLRSLLERYGIHYITIWQEQRPISYLIDQTE